MLLDVYKRQELEDTVSIASTTEDFDICIINFSVQIWKQKQPSSRMLKWTSLSVTTEDKGVSDFEEGVDVS